jgi:chromosomal replication initiation ATPase DnaA
MIRYYWASAEIDTESLADACKKTFGVKKEHQSSRRRNAVQARQAFCNKLRGHYTTCEIARLTKVHFGMKSFDHSTVIHATKTIKNYLVARDSISKDFARKYECIQNT